LNYYNGYFHVLYQTWDDGDGYSHVKYGKYISNSWSSNSSIVSFSEQPCFNTGMTLLGNSTREIVIYTNASENTIYYRYRVTDGYGDWSDPQLWLIESSPQIQENIFHSWFMEDNEKDFVLVSWATSSPINMRQATFGLTFHGIQIDVLIYGLHQWNYTQIPITINGINYYFGDTAILESGSYTLLCSIPSNLSDFIFSSWNYNGSISISSLSSSNTIITINGNGWVILNLNLSYETISRWYWDRFNIWFIFLGVGFMLAGSTLTVKNIEDHEFDRALICLLVVVPIGFSFIALGVFG